jgi:hypothetical protein
MDMLRYRNTTLPNGVSQDRVPPTASLLLGYLSNNASDPGLHLDLAYVVVVVVVPVVSNTDYPILRSHTMLYALRSTLYELYELRPTLYDNDNDNTDVH